MYVYIYIYIYGCCTIPPCFLTTLQYTKLHGVQAKLSHLYMIMQKHTITHVYCRRETLGHHFSNLSNLFNILQRIVGHRFSNFPNFLQRIVGHHFSNISNFSNILLRIVWVPIFVQNVGQVGTMMPNDSLKTVGKLGKVGKH